MQPTADFSLKGLDPDPGHEFADVQQQLAGGNGGFVNNYAAQHAADPGRVMNCFSPAQLPVLNQMAASSGGLTKSPTTGDIIKATTLQGYGFQHGNIFDALDKNGIPWCIVEGDLFPVSFALGANGRKLGEGEVCEHEQFCGEAG